MEEELRGLRESKWGLGEGRKSISSVNRMRIEMRVLAITSVGQEMRKRSAMLCMRYDAEGLLKKN